MRIFRQIREKIVIWWKNQPLWKKITSLAIALLILFLSFTNQSFLINALRWLGIIWRPETAVVAYKSLDKPFWSLWIIRFVCNTGGLLFTWWLVGLTMQTTKVLEQKPGIFGKLSRKFKENFEKQSKNPKFQKRLAWFKDKGTPFLYLAMLIPYWPILPTIIIVIARVRRLKHSLFILFIANTIRNTFVLWALWKGISLFSLFK